MLHLSSKNFAGYLWNSAASIRLRLWPIAISMGLYLRIFLHPSALMNHLILSNLQKSLNFPKQNLKSFREHSFKCHGAICLELTTSRSQKFANIISIQI